MVRVQPNHMTKAMRTKHRGFTLFELLITVALVAILAGVAYPSYQNAMVKSRRAAAQAFLADVAQRQQQYLLDNRSYAATATDLKVAVPDDVSRYYDLAIAAPAATPPSFTATVTPKPGAQLADGALSIDSAGTKTPAGKW
jgi:type IV pilus assembly protein PilE